MRKKTAPGTEGTSSEQSNSLKVRKKKDTALSRESEDPAWQTLTEKIGGRDGLLKAAVASQNPKAAVLAELLLDPAFKNSGTKKLAQRAGLTMPEIVDLYRDKQWLETTLILHEKLPAIIDGATDDAKPKMVPCEECKASGKSETGDKCWVCGGWGEVRRPGDKDKLNFVGEAVGMTGKKGPFVQVNTQVNANGPQLTHSFDDLVRKATITINKQKQVEGEAEEEK